MVKFFQEGREPNREPETWTGMNRNRPETVPARTGQNRNRPEPEPAKNVKKI